MDITALAAALLVAFGLLTADAVVNANDVVVEVVAPPRSDKYSIDEATLEQTFEGQLQAIAATQSLIDPPEIRARRKQGVALALAQAARVEGVAYALQTEMGYEPDRLRLALFVQNGVLRGMVTGYGHSRGVFQQVLVPRDDESVPAFVRRAALFGASQLAPYTTALYLLQVHAGDQDFTDVLGLASQAEAQLPPTPINLQRSLYENIQGIVFLFRNDAKSAKAAFARAVAADTGDPVAVLNLAFADLEVDDNQDALHQMEHLIQEAPPHNHVLLATAYVTWAAAEMGLNDLPRADALLAKAVEIDPSSSTAFGLWAEAKDQEGDHAAAADLRTKALAATADGFENYAEVATLYFHLSWQNGKPTTRSRFGNAPPITFNN